MVRTFRLITLAPKLAESRLIGPRISATTSALRLSAEDASTDLPYSIPSMEQLLEEHAVTRLPLTIVLPNSAITFRKLEFPFNGTRQVTEALTYELESELLDDLDNYIYAHRQIPSPTGGAIALVYLIERPIFQSLMSTCVTQGVHSVLVTFSASALYLSAPPPSPLHFQVYAGAEETFISLIRGNQLHAVWTFPFDPILPVLNASEHPITTTRAFMNFLERREPHAPSETVIQGEEILPPLAAPSAMHSEGEDRRRSSGTEQELFVNRFRREFEDQLPALNRFIRLHALGEAATLSLHGIFAPFLEWEPKDLQIRMRDDVPAIANTESISTPYLPPRDSLGIIEDLCAHPDKLRPPGLIRFTDVRESWQRRIQEFRRPLLALGTLVAVFLVLLGVNFILALTNLKNQAERIEQRITASLEAYVPARTSDANGLAILRERLDQREAEVAKQRRFAERRYNVLNMLSQISDVYASSDGVTVDTLTYNQDRLVVTGVAPSYNESESLRSALTALESFSQGEANLTHQRNQQDITYRITIDR